MGASALRSGARRSSATPLTVQEPPSSSTIDVTPASVMPQAMMLLKRSAELSTLSAKPCMVVRLATRTPMAQIFRSGRSPEA